MSNPSSAPSSGRRPDPATATQEELFSYLAVDPTTGLSGREADRRRDRAATRPLFTTTARPFSRCLMATLREPVLWIMLAVSCIALFFNREVMGVVCLLLTAAHALLCAYFLYRAERVDGTMQRAYDAPLPRVMRSGRVCRVGAEAVVPGDILLIHEGDLIPADCRLLRTDRFSVSERELDTTNPDRPNRRLDKDADYISEQEASPRVSPPNMVYAGAVAEEGFAVALVVAVGENTHVGSLLGSIRPAHGGRRPAAQSAMAKVSSFVSMLLVILFIPLVVLGIITLGDKHDFFDIFLSVLALTTLWLCELTVCKLAYVAASIRRDAAVARDAVNRADIRAAADVERLCEMTDLILLGSAALHDGIPHPVGLFAGGRNHGCDEPDTDEETDAAVELLFLWQYGRAALPTHTVLDGQELDTVVEALAPDLFEWAGIDPEGLLIKYKDIRPEEGGVSAVVDTPDGNRRIWVTATTHSGEFSDPELAAAQREAEERGLSTLCVIRSTERQGGSWSAQGSVIAMLTYAPYTCPKTAGWIKSMEAAGIRVTALLSTDRPEDIRALEACELCERYPVDRPAHEGDRRIADRIGGGIRAFLGCSDREIADCIRDLRAEGRIVGVLSVDERDVRHLNAADVAFTCSPSVYAEAESGFLRPAQNDTSAVADGLPYASRATDLGRRRADVVVRRTSREGGGLGGVRMALISADRTREALAAASAYLLLANAARLLTVIFSMAFGLLPVPAPVLLIAGWGVDTLVLYFLSRTSAAKAPAPRHSVVEGLARPWYTHRVRLICLGVTVAMPWIVALAARLLAADIGTGLAGYALLCLVAKETALYLTLRPHRKDRTSASATLTLALVYVGALAAALSAGLHPLYAILVPPVPALLYALADAICRRFRVYRA